jgi:DNA-binding PadR family transcriptional regulator
MDNRTTQELEMLITVSQNKKVPTTDFHHLLEHKWKSYNIQFNDLESEGLFKISKPIPGTDISIYELTPKGKMRITELLEKREREIDLRLIQLKQRAPQSFNGWKSIFAQINAHFHPPAHELKISNTALKSDFGRIKSWLHARFHKQAVRG